MSVNEKMTAIADAIRDKTGGTDKLGLDAMATGVGEVYAAGRESWHTDYYNNAVRTGFANFMHAGYAWHDNVYDPPGTLRFSVMNYMFQYSQITDTKVDIDITVDGNPNKAGLFQYSTIKTIRKLIVCEENNLASIFTGANKIQNITFEGVIGRSLNMQWCPLTVASMKNIIEHLKNHKGTDTEGAYTLTFSEDCWAALDADGLAPDGGTWKNYVSETYGINT